MMVFQIVISSLWNTSWHLHRSNSCLSDLCNVSDPAEILFLVYSMIMSSTPFPNYFTLDVLSVLLIKF